MSEKGNEDFHVQYTTLLNSLIILDSKSGTMSPSIIRFRKNQPSKWVILGIIFGIIFFAIAFVGVCVLLRVYRLGGKHKTTDS